MNPEPQTDAEASVSPILRRSFDAFYRNLPELLKTHCRQWVAFHGDECIGFARTQTELYQRCLRQGLKEDEFEVLLISPMALDDRKDIDAFPNCH